MKCLVVGIVFNLNISDIAPFFVSLRKHYKGEICIITPEKNQQILDFYKQYNVNVVDIKLNNDRHVAFKQRISIINTLLKCVYHNVDKVFFTDVRDVYFFGDIFTCKTSAEITFFAEPQLIGNCSINSRWYEMCYGADELNKVRNNLIICNGTILATKQGMLNYTELMLDEVDKSNYVTDQTNTNYLIHNNKISNFEILKHGEGPIGTFTHDKNMSECVVVDHRLFNKNNNTAVLVAHQYDRCEVLNNYISNYCFFDKHLSNREIYELCTALYNGDQKFIELRNFIVSNRYGFCDNEHYVMWDKLVHNQRNHFKFIEIGVYKGQMIALLSLLAKRHNLNCNIYGVTPLEEVGDKYTVYDKVDYLGIIKLVHQTFGVEFNENQLIKGLSTDSNIKNKVRSLGGFDIVYVDGGHDYETVVSDINLAKEICNVGGYIVMDDSSNYKDFNGLNIFQGHNEVSLATIDHLANDVHFSEKSCVGHNRIFQKSI